MAKRIFNTVLTSGVILLFVFIIHGITVDTFKFYVLGIIISTPVLYLMNYVLFPFLAKKLNWQKQD